MENLHSFSYPTNKISFKDIEPLFNQAQERILESGELYIKQNETSKKLAFIVKGIIRCYTIKSNGAEATLLFRWEEQFIGSHESIILHTPSKFFYQALEETKILEINYDILEKILEDNPKYESLRNTITLTMLSEALQMIEDFVVLSPEQRYLKLISEKKDIINRISDKYLASMLGVTPVSLSRIRNRISKRKRN